MKRSVPAQDLEALSPVGEDDGDTQLIVFLRAPRLHEVKTRLAAELGAEKALAAYRELLGTLLGNLRSLHPVQLRFTPDDAGPEVSAWARADWSLAGQGSGSLGERLLRAFGDAFQRGYGRVAIIGSDCPTATAADVRSAWEALRRADLVIGPATDGGYWLVALSRPYPVLFEEVAWGTSSVLATTLARAEAEGLSVALLEPRHDIDTLADWEQYRRKQVKLAPNSASGKVRR